MAFSCKIVLGEHKKEDGTRMLYLQAIIDRVRSKVPLGFYVNESSFDQKRQCMKSHHPNAKSYDTEFLKAIAKANGIASRFRVDNLILTPSVFRNEFTNPGEKMDFIKFIQKELELRRPTLSANTYKQHNTVINKLKSFKKIISFQEVSIELFQQFQNYLIKEYKNSGPTINKLLKIVRQYLRDARKKGMKFNEVDFKIKSFKSNRLSLSQLEVDKLNEYYSKTDCNPRHRKVLRYFLFSCFTGVRISDIKLLTWNNIHDNLLVFTPEKTKSSQKTVTVPLISLDKKYLPATDKGLLFDTYVDQVTNRYLKEVAKEVGIKKKVSYHTSRHTFGSLFAEGGNIVALQKMMGHGSISTTMGYIHTNTQNLIDAKRERFGE